MIYPYYNYYIGNSPIQGNAYVWVGAEDVKDLPGIPGQGSGNPKSYFSNHAVVLVNGTCYDPSYGTMYTDDPSGSNPEMINMELNAIAGYGINNQVDRRWEIREKYKNSCSIDGSIQGY